jgi:hypothetical protein
MPAPPPLSEPAMVKATGSFRMAASNHIWQGFRNESVAINALAGFLVLMKKNWQQLIREGAQSTPIDPREAFIAALAQAHADIEEAFTAEGRSIRIEKGDKPGLGSVVVENKLRKELVLTVNASEKAVAFRVFNTQFESYDCNGGSPNEYDVPILRNVVAYFYNLAMTGQKVPAKVNAADFVE